MPQKNLALFAEDGVAYNFQDTVHSITNFNRKKITMAMISQASTANYNKKGYLLTVKRLNYLIFHTLCLYNLFMVYNNLISPHSTRKFLCL